MPLISSTLPELTLHDAQAIVREPVLSVQRVGAGTRSGVYRVETVEGSVRVVRLTPRAAQRPEREAWVRARLKKHPAVPLVAEVRVTHLPLCEQVDVVSMAELPGTTLAQAERALFEPELCALWGRLGEALGALHEVPTEGFGLLDGAGRGAARSWPEQLDALTRAALEELRVAALPDALRERVAAALEALAPVVDAAQPARLLHGDPQPGNAQVQRGRLVALFDFEFAAGGDPAYELAAVEPFFEPATSPSARATGDELRARRAAFYAGYSAQRAGFAPPPPERQRLYRLLHALRSTEYLSVVGPLLAPDERERSARRARAQLERLCEPSDAVPSRP